MRKIMSKQEEAKKAKKNQLIIGIILIGVMFTSVLGFTTHFGGGLGGNSNQGTNNDQAGSISNYNGFEFYPGHSGLWFLDIGGGSFGFTNLPQRVEKINSEVNLLNSYVGKPLYIDSVDSGAELEITRNLGQVAQRVQQACLREGECVGDLPIKTCEDNFIIIKEDTLTNIIQEDNCVFILGPKEDLVEIADEFLFKILSVN